MTQVVKRSHFTAATLKKLSDPSTEYSLTRGDKLRDSDALPRWFEWLRIFVPKIGMATALLVLTGCSVLMRDTPVPIPTLMRPVSSTGRTETLVVFLPGRGDTMADYERAGIITTLREAGVKADAIIVDAHLGYYYQRTVVERLHADVFHPAREKGYRRIVLVGVSLGGLGGLLGEHDRPGSVDALVLLGPFLGEDNALFDRIDAAGGPVAWAGGRDPKAGKVEEQLWTFLGSKTSDLPPTWLLSGRDDKYGRGQRLFAGLLPASRVKIVEGDHGWHTWSKLWRDFCINSDAFQAERTDASSPH